MNIINIRTLFIELSFVSVGGIIMKAKILFTILLGLGQSFATPFIYPKHWFGTSGTENKKNNLIHIKKGGSLRVGKVRDFKTFNPFTTVEAENIPRQLSAGASLFTVDIITDKFIPLMAQEMPQILNDGKTFIVKIRKGMRFSDGKPITADDWVTTYTIHSDKAVGSLYLRDLMLGPDITKVKKIDKYTLQFDFPYPTPAAYSKMSLTPWPHHIFGPVYTQGGAKAIKEMWGLNTKPQEIISPGAWTLQNYTSGQQAILGKNVYFGLWSKDNRKRSLPYLNFIKIRVFNDEKAVLSSYLAGELDIYNPRHADDLSQIKKAIDKKKLKANLLANLGPERVIHWITFNWNRKSDPYKEQLFRDFRFRRAMSHLSNRKAMIKLALGGTGTPTFTSIPLVFKKYQFKDTPHYPYNPKAASELLTRIGYTRKNSAGYLINNQGQIISFDLAFDAKKVVDQRMAQIFADDAKKAGIKVNLKPLDFNLIVQHLVSEGPDRKWDATLLSLGGGERYYPYMSAVMGCGSAFHPYNRLGEGKCLTPAETKIANLFKKGERTLDDDKRRNIGKQIAKTEGEQQAIIYLASQNYHFSHNERIGGWYKKELINAINRHGIANFIGNYFK